MTRDSRWWWLAMAGAWLGSLAVNPDLVERMIEGEQSAWVAALCQLLAIVAGVMRASPINKLSARGRRKYQEQFVRLRPLDADD